VGGFDVFCACWLVSHDLPYCPAARAARARAFPALFGRDYTVTLRRYERWRARRAFPDTLETFGQYMDGRYARWLAAGGQAPAARRRSSSCRAPRSRL
jgi:hypothetical protein